MVPLNMLLKFVVFYRAFDEVFLRFAGVPVTMKPVVAAKAPTAKPMKLTAKKLDLLE